MNNQSRPVVLVDLDGTLAQYDQWRGPTHIGAPVEKMLARVKKWIARGDFDVKIFTARVGGDDADTVRPFIEAWCLEHVGVVLPVTCKKDYSVVQIWDDRAVRVIANRGHACCTNGMPFGPDAVDPEENDGR